jgi:hypothetical protein
MAKPLAEKLIEWLEAGLLDRAQVDRILAFEGEHTGRVPPWDRFAPLAMAVGVLLVAAGALLFVAANWPHLSPGVRMLGVMVLVGGFHVGGAVAAGRSGPAMALHGAGTLALGAGIFLAGQIFNLQEHWPGGVMLWALGAWIGFALLGHWVQLLLAAVLTPAWLVGEWMVLHQAAPSGELLLPAVGCLVLAITYLSEPMPGRESPLRRGLAWIGGLWLIPGVLAVVLDLGRPWRAGTLGRSWGVALAGWTLALGGPLALAAIMRGRAAWMNAIATLWAVALAWMVAGSGWEPGWTVYALCGVGAAGLVLWGLMDARGERVNLGLAGFAITLLAFYFSNVMDKLGRSLGLMGLGVLFLAGGWQLERLRRKLQAMIGRGRA